MKCERCSKQTDSETYELFDYCAKCSKNLCPDCMKKGCCGKVPAVSGNNEENSEEEDSEEEED